MIRKFWRVSGLTSPTTIQSHIPAGKISLFYVSSDILIFLVLNTGNGSEGNRVNFIKQGFQIAFVIHAKYDLLPTYTWDAVLRSI